MKVTFGEDVAACRLNARVKVNAVFASKRTEYIPTGLDATYQDKEAQARAFLSYGTQGGYVTSEATTRGVSETEAANSIIAKADAARTVVEALDSARLAANVAIDAATQPNEIEAIVKAFRAENI